MDFSVNPQVGVSSEHSGVGVTVTGYWILDVDQSRQLRGQASNHTAKAVKAHTYSFFIFRFIFKILSDG